MHNGTILREGFSLYRGCSELTVGPLPGTGNGIRTNSAEFSRDRPKRVRRRTTGSPVHLPVEVPRMKRGSHPNKKANNTTGTRYKYPVRYLCTRPKQKVIFFHHPPSHPREYTGRSCMQLQPPDSVEPTCLVNATSRRFDGSPLRCVSRKQQCYRWLGAEELAIIAAVPTWA